MKVQVPMTSDTGDMLVYDKARSFTTMVVSSVPNHSRLLAAVKLCSEAGGFKAYFNAWKQSEDSVRAFVSSSCPLRQYVVFVAVCADCVVMPLPPTAVQIVIDCSKRLPLQPW